MTPKMSCPFTHFFWNFNPPQSEMGDGTKLWECFRNHLIQFIIFGFGTVSSDTSIQELILLYFPCIFPVEKYTSVWILIVLLLQTNFAKSGLSFLLPSCLGIPKNSSTGSWQNLPVKMNMQLIWSKHFTVLTVDLTAIYMPWYVCKLTNI